MYGTASVSTRQVSAATGANAATPTIKTSATAASGSRRRPRNTLPPAWSQAAVNASRNAVPDTRQPYSGPALWTAATGLGAGGRPPGVLGELVLDRCDPFDVEPQEVAEEPDHEQQVL